MNSSRSIPRTRCHMLIGAALAVVLLAITVWATNPRQAQAAPPEVYSRFLDLGTTTTTTPSLTRQFEVPTGAYAGNAKLTAESLGTLQTLDCTLRLNTDNTDTARTALENHFTRTIALQAVSASAFRITLSCTVISGSGTTQFTHIKVTAIRVNSVDNRQFT
jgi:hypothetical protein